MKLKYLLWPLGAILVVVGGVWIRYRILASNDEAAFQEQLRLARADGIPTNATEFEATIRPAKPDENAAEYYRVLKPLIKPLGDLQATDVALLRHPSSKTLAAARKLLLKAKSALDIIDKAALKPRCWFNRDWTEGAATLLPEYSDMKAASRLLALRGSIAAMDGNGAGALANIREILVLSCHAGEDGNAISALVSSAIYAVGLHELASWGVLHPEQAEYREALAAALRAEPKPDLRRENRDQLFMVLSLLDLSSTEKGRQKLGLKEEDQPAGAKVLSIILSRPKSRIAIVKAGRDFWAALELPPSEMADAISRADMQQTQAILAFPEAARMYEVLEYGNDHVSTRIPDWQARQLEYKAVLRALSGGRVARSIRTDDLQSPYNESSLTYFFDGKQMDIEVSRPGDSRPLRLRIPPDELRPFDAAAIRSR